MMRNIAFIVLDAVRKDYFDNYAPRLRGLADAEFDRCYAPSSWTVPSHASMLTGQLPHQHGVHAHNIDLGDLNTEDVFLTELDTHRTLGVSANANANIDKGFDTYFDEFHAESFNRLGVVSGGLKIDDFAAENDGLRRYVDFVSDAADKGELARSLANGAFVKMHDIAGIVPPVERREDYGADTVISRSLAETDGKEPFFLYNNFMEAHMPHRPVSDYDDSIYDASASWTSYDVNNWHIINSDDIADYAVFLRNLRGLYAAAIDYLDRQLTEYIRALQSNTNREMTVVVTADHGEMLGESPEGLVGHNPGGVHERLLHVPLLIFNPPERLADTSEPVTLLDADELCLSLADGGRPDLGRDRIPAERIGIAGRDSLKHINDFERWDRAERCVYSGDRKVVVDSASERRVYCVGDVACEQTEVDDSDVSFDGLVDVPIDEYKQSLLATDGAAVPDRVSDDVRRRLEDLGYG